MKGFASFGTRRRRVAGLGLLMSTMIVTSVTVANAQTLTWLGTLGGGYSVARDVSADGRVVVGWAENASGQRRAFRWTQAGGMKDLGTLAGNTPPLWSLESSQARRACAVPPHSVRI